MTELTIDLDRLRADIAEKRRELEELQAIESVAMRYSVARGSANGATFTPAAPVYLTLADIQGKTILDAVKAVLRAAGKPLKTREISDTLVATGYGAKWAKPQNAVFTALTRRASGVKKIDAGTWGLDQD